MITGIDHLVLVTADLVEATENYRLLLGREPDWTAINKTDGTAISIFKIENIALEIMGPYADGPVGDKLKSMVESGEGGLTSLAFSCDDIDATHKQFKRRGLNPSDITSGQSIDEATQTIRSWRRIRLDTLQTYGVRHFVLENTKDQTIETKKCADNCVSALDHLVINSPDAMRASALYGTRLGLDLRLDLVRPDLATHFQFFRAGKATIEIVSRLNVETDRASKDVPWGMSWSVKDLDAAHIRIKNAGFSVSDIRQGRKIGSRVFTVLDRTCNTPTLFIQQPTQ